MVMSNWKIYVEEWRKGLMFILWYNIIIDV